EKKHFLTEWSVMKSSSLHEKWGNEALLMGWTAIPSSLLMLQKTLGIDSVALNVLMNLTASWWETAKNPYPSQQVIAERMGTSKRTVQRAIRELENLRLLEVKRTEITHPVFKGRNVYDLSPLVEILIKLTPTLKHLNREDDLL
ncbi:helix-turn-helix domain-containing protein, partial [Klebsiella pneumoniae subsp. pneumoniae]